MKKISACPGWLEVSEDRGSFIFLADRAEIVRKIFELSIAGLGSYTIAKQLSRQNVPPFGTSKHWDPTTIDSMLRNRAVVGEYQPRSFAGGSKKGVPTGTPIPNYYPAIVDEETFRAAQEARQQNLATGRGRKGNNFANLFTGLTTCAYCGGAVKFHSNGASKSLICSTALAAEGCVRAGWSYKNFESSVLHFICHPALALTLEPSKRKLWDQLVTNIQRLPVDAGFDARSEVSALLKQAISMLELSNAGELPRVHRDARIVRDLASRRFRIALWGGRPLLGSPIL